MNKRKQEKEVKVENNKKKIRDQIGSDLMMNKEEKKKSKKRN